MGVITRSKLNRPARSANAAANADHCADSGGRTSAVPIGARKREESPDEAATGAWYRAQ
jgi:hypothetical protein